MRSILDRVGAILPGRVTDLLGSAAAAAQDGSLEVDDTLDVPPQARMDAERMYELLDQAIEGLRASIGLD